MDTLVLKNFFKGGVGVCQVKMLYKTQYALNSPLNAPNSLVMARGEYFIDCTPFCPSCVILRRLTGSCVFFLRYQVQNSALGGGASVSACLCLCVYACVRVYACAREKGLSFSLVSLFLSLALSFFYSLLSFYSL